MHSIVQIEKGMKENRSLFRQVEIISQKLEAGEF
jgi:hypothetical protein